MIRVIKVFQIFFFAVILLAILEIFIYFTYKSHSELLIKQKTLFDVDRIEKITWENDTLIAYERSRVGPGEHSLPFVLTDPEDIAKNKELFEQEGFYVVVSDKISVNRALADNRPYPCGSKKYLRRLPTVSVVITFHNEVWSVLLRCVHSILNRSPKGLLREIILINDKSTFPELYEPLQNYFNGTFDSKVKIYNNDERQGLIKARMTGAMLAKGGAIIFLDSHMEVGTTWLPPLLEPLVYHSTYATVPMVDGINYATFAYEGSGHIFRGTFDWSFRYTWLPFRKNKKPKLGENFEISSMTGGAYAITRKQFFHLGGYDEQLQIWNGENYELSFKLWLCGGGILTVPCSRVAHLNKVHSSYRTTGDDSDFIGRNLKRVAEVWLDDYKKFFYETDQERFDKIDPGDLTKQLELKKKLNCKPFKYFLDVIAPEMVERYPVDPPQYFAMGAIQNLALNLCISSQEFQFQLPIILTNCGESLQKPKKFSNFTLTVEKTIRIRDPNDQCLCGNKLRITNCDHKKGHQNFIFNITTRQIFYPSKEMCLTAKNLNEPVVLEDCDDKSDFQKFKWGFENETALNNWEKSGLNYSEFDNID